MSAVERFVIVVRCGIPPAVQPPNAPTSDPARAARPFFARPAVRVVLAAGVVAALLTCVGAFLVARSLWRSGMGFHEASQERVSPGRHLTPAEVESVVKTRAPALREECWVHATGAPTEARFSLALAIDGDGGVTDARVSAEGDPVAACAGRVVHTWRFAATGGVTTVNVPFHFLRQ